MIPKIQLKKIFYSLIVSVLVFSFTPYGKQLFSQTGIRWFYVLLISFCISYLLVPVTIILSEKMAILDYPDTRKVHSKPTPLLGGLAVYIAFIVSMFANFIFSTAVRGIIIGGTLIIIIGISDDLFKNRVSARLKLLVQILATFIVIESGVSLSLFHEAHLLGRLINIFLTVFWVVGLTNAMNFIDGMDGLAAGLSGIIAFFLGVVAFQTQQPFLGWFAVAVLGACLGFLPYNLRWRKPASVFLGDTGSTFLGFTLASLAILGEWADLKPIVSLTAPLLIFGILIFDMCYITFARLKNKTFHNLNEFIEYVGKDHLHHRLDGLFHSKGYTVLFIYFLSIALGIAAVVLRYARTIDALLLLLQAVIILLIVTILEQEAKKRRKAKEKETD